MSQLSVDSVKTKDWIDVLACVCNALQFLSGIILYNCEVYVLSGYNDQLLAVYILGSFLLFVLFVVSLFVCLVDSIANQMGPRESSITVCLEESQFLKRQDLL